jgi:hypothetical protein
MGRRYNTEDRIFGGSMEPRLNPEFGADRIPSPQPRRPSPMARATSSGGSIAENGNAQRRRLIGLPSRFDRE